GHIQVRVEADRDLAGIIAARLRYRNVTRPGEVDVTTRLDIQRGGARSQDPALSKLLIDLEELAFRSGAARIEIDAIIPGDIRQPDNRARAAVNHDLVDAILDDDQAGIDLIGGYLAQVENIGQGKLQERIGA